MTENPAADEMPEQARAGVRASDAEREAFAETITVASRDGRLTVTEVEDRITRIFAATFREELPEIVADLPQDTWPPAFRKPQVTELRSVPSGPRPSVWRGGLLVHAIVVGVIAVASLGAWRHSGAPFFWPAWPLTWLGLSVLVHYRIRLRNSRWRAHWTNRRPGDPSASMNPGYHGPFSSNRQAA